MSAPADEVPQANDAAAAAAVTPANDAPAVAGNSALVQELLVQLVKSNQSQAKSQELQAKTQEMQSLNMIALQQTMENVATQQKDASNDIKARGVLKVEPLPTLTANLLAKGYEEPQVSAFANALVRHFSVIADIFGTRFRHSLKIETPVQDPFTAFNTLYKIVAACTPEEATFQASLRKFIDYLVLNVLVPEKTPYVPVGVMASRWPIAWNTFIVPFFEEVRCGRVMFHDFKNTGLHTAFSQAVAFSAFQTAALSTPPKNPKDKRAATTPPQPPNPKKPKTGNSKNTPGLTIDNTNGQVCKKGKCANYATLHADHVTLGHDEFEERGRKSRA